MTVLFSNIKRNLASKFTVSMKLCCRQLIASWADARKRQTEPEALCRLGLGMLPVLASNRLQNRVEQFLGDNTESDFTCCLA